MSARSVRGRDWKRSHRLHHQGAGAITTFLNEPLALTIDLQNILFTAFEQRLPARIEGAIASGNHDVGLETLTG